MAALPLLDDSGLAALQVLDQGGLAGQGEFVGPEETVRKDDLLYLSYFRQLTSGNGTQLERREEAFTTPKVIQSGQTEASEDLVSKDIESAIPNAFTAEEAELPEATKTSESDLPEAKAKALISTNSELLQFSQARELGLPQPIQFEEPWLLEAIPGDRVRTPRGQPRPFEALDTELGQNFRTIRGHSRPGSQKREPVLPEATQDNASEPSEVPQDYRARTVRGKTSSHLSRLNSQEFQDRILGRKPVQRVRKSKCLSSQENHEFQEPTKAFEIDLICATKGQRIRAFRVLKKPKNNNFEIPSDKRDSIISENI